MVDALRPITLDEALEMRKTGKVIPFSGGTDLMVRRKSWSGTLPRFEYPALFIGGLEELRKIQCGEGVLTIGSAATLASVLQHEAVPVILKRAVSEMASPAIRNVGTLGGNICNASPAGDSLPVLYVLGAAVVLKSNAGCREMPVEEFIKGPGKIELHEDELLVEINIPLEDFTMASYRKVGSRKADALSKLSFVGMARMENEVLKDIRMAFGAVAPTVVRLKEAENILKGRKVKELPELIADVKGRYSQYIRPIDDQRSNAVYRKTVALRLMEKFITELMVSSNN